MQLHYFVLISFGTFKFSDAGRIVLKEGRWGELKCKVNNVLDITFAKYEGRSFFCGDHEVTDIVRRQCNGKQTCKVHAVDEHYTDSCRLASEVLTVIYKCTEQIVTPTIDNTPEYVSMTTAYQTTNTSVDYSLSNHTDVPLKPRESPLTSTTTNETITIATLVGCIFGLLLVGAITIVIYRRFRENKFYENDNVEILHITSVPEQEGESRRACNKDFHGQNGRINISGKKGQKSLLSYGNNCYTLDGTGSQVNPEVIRNKSLPGEIETTTCKYTGDYSVLQKNTCSCISAECLPPAYDVAMSDRLLTVNNSDRYNHAHYTGEEYDDTARKTALLGCANLSDGYSTSATLLLESADCAATGSSSEHVYENQNSRVNLKNTNYANDFKLTDSNESDEKKKNNFKKTVEPGKSNKYDTVELKNPTQNKGPYQNVDTTEWTNNQHGYMPMAFGRHQSTIDENEYVPIMSPTTSCVTSDMIDDTYQF